MAGEAASALGLSMAVLAEHPDDAACGVAAEVVLGSPQVEADLHALAARCDVVTFDHEQVDLSVVRALEADGVVLRPGVATLEVAVDKGHMRRVLVDAGIDVPGHAVVDLDPGGAAAGAAAAAVEEIGAFAAVHGWPVVVKATRGGYDGKGVWTAATRGRWGPPWPTSRRPSWSRRWCRSRRSWPSWWPGALPESRWSGRPWRRPRSEACAREVLVPGRLPATVVGRPPPSGRGWPRSSGRSACWPLSSSGPRAVYWSTR